MIHISLISDDEESEPPTLKRLELVTEESTSSNKLAIGSLTSPQMPIELGNDSLNRCTSVNIEGIQETAPSIKTSLEIIVVSAKKTRKFL